MGRGTAVSRSCCCHAQQQPEEHAATWSIGLGLSCRIVTSEQRTKYASLKSSGISSGVSKKAVGAVSSSSSSRSNCVWPRNAASSRSWAASVRGRP